MLHVAILQPFALQESHTGHRTPSFCCTMAAVPYKVNQVVSVTGGALQCNRPAWCLCTSTVAGIEVFDVEKKDTGSRRFVGCEAADWHNKRLVSDLRDQRTAATLLKQQNGASMFGVDNTAAGRRHARHVMGDANPELVEVTLPAVTGEDGSQLPPLVVNVVGSLLPYEKLRMEVKAEILDHLRLHALCRTFHDLTPILPPTIRAPYRDRFKRIVEYYFPSDSSLF